MSIILICVLCSCTKELSSPSVEDQAQTATDLARKAAVKRSVPKKDTYTYNYVGDSGEGFDATFPAWNINEGTVTSWTATITRKITGSTVLVNTSGSQNTSKISLSRYTVVTQGGMNIASWPNSVVLNINQTIGKGKTMTVPISAVVTDVITNTASTLHNLDGDGTVPLVWHFDDLVSVFKANCDNNSTLEDNVTVTVTYTYISN